MARIGIMGGTFNPVHNAHLIVANEAMHQDHLDKIVFMPDNIPPHKNHKHAISVRQRLTMLQLATASNPKFYVNDFEARHGGKSYTYKTAQQLHIAYPSDKFYWIIGGDEVRYLHTWKHIDQLKSWAEQSSFFHFIAVDRGSKLIDKHAISAIADWVKIPRFDISSTMIRKRIRNRQTTKYLLPDAVRDYIEKNMIYLMGSLKS